MRDDWCVSAMGHPNIDESGGLQGHLFHGVMGAVATLIGAAVFIGVWWVELLLEHAKWEVTKQWS